MSETADTGAQGPGFGRLALACFLTSTGMMSFLPGLPLWLEERYAITDRAELFLVTGSVFGAAPLAAAFAGPFWGALGDRLGRKWNLVRAQLAIVVFIGLFPLAPNPGVLVFLRLLQGACAGWIAPAFSLATAGMPARRRGRRLWGLQIALTLGLLTGPLLGAEVALTFSRDAVFWLCSGLAASGLVIALTLREDRSLLRLAEGRGAARGIVADLGEVLRARSLGLFLGAMFAARFGISLVEHCLALVVRELGPVAALAREGDPSSAVDRTTAALWLLQAAGALCFSGLWLRLGAKRGPLRVLAACGLVAAAALLASSLARDGADLCGLRAVYAFGLAGVLPLSYEAISRITHERAVSAAYALNQSAVQLALGLGYFVGGWVAGFSSIGGLFLVSGSCCFVAFASLPFLRRRHMRLEAAAQVSGAAASE